MTTPANERLWRAFDQGRAEELLADRGAPADPTWRDRPDRLLVLRQLAAWGHERQRVEEATGWLLKAVRRLTEDAPNEAVDLLWSYTLVCSSDDTRIGEPGALRQMAERALDRADSTDLQIVGQVVALRQALASDSWPSGQ